LGFTDVSVSAKMADFIDLKNWPQEVLTKCCYIPHASRQLAQESTTKQVNSYLTATQSGAVS